MSRMVSVARADEIAAGAVKQIWVDDEPIAIFNVGGEYFAITDNCTHEDTPLSEGYLDEDECDIECPLHGSRFDLRTGKALTLPAIFPVRVFEVTVEGDEIKIEVDS